MVPIGGCSVGLPKIQPILVAMATWSCFPLPISQCSPPAIAHVSPPRRGRGRILLLPGGSWGMTWAMTVWPPSSGAGTHHIPCPGGREGSGP